MVQIKLEHATKGLTAYLELTDRLSIVTGNSGTGKTHLCSMIQASLDEDNGVFTISAYDTVTKKDTSVYFARSTQILQQLLTDPATERSVIVCDEYTTDKLYKEPALRNDLSKYNKYVLLFDRETSIVHDVGVNSLFDLKYINGMYQFLATKLIKCDNDFHLDSKLKTASCILTEDAKSSFEVLSAYFSDYVDVVTSRGNGRFYELALKECAKGNTVVCFLDYDQGGALVQKFSLFPKKFRSSLIFVEMECFEELICNSDFFLKSVDIATKDRVLNIMSYYDCSWEHKGKYYYQLLCSGFKYKGRTLYNKGNVDCLSHECCIKSITDCSFITTDKVKSLFSNKYLPIYNWFKYLENGGKPNVTITDTRN